MKDLCFPSFFFSIENWQTSSCRNCELLAQNWRYHYDLNESPRCQNYCPKIVGEISVSASVSAVNYSKILVSADHEKNDFKTPLTCTMQFIFEMHKIVLKFTFCVMYMYCSSNIILDMLLKLSMKLSEVRYALNNEIKCTCTCTCTCTLKL